MNRETKAVADLIPGDIITDPRKTALHQGVTVAGFPFGVMGGTLVPVDKDGLYMGVFVYDPEHQVDTLTANEPASTPPAE